MMIIGCDFHTHVDVALPSSTSCATSNPHDGALPNSHDGNEPASELCSHRHILEFLQITCYRRSWLK